MRVLVAVALVVLAGCSAATDEQATDDEDDGHVVKGPSTKRDDAAPDAPGNLTGRVRDDVNYSIEGALVAVLGTSHAAITDEDGRFRIEGILPGTHTIRVNPTGDYRSLEDQITVAPGEELEVTIIVVPSIDRGPGYRPHVHDYWRGLTTYTMMDEAVDFRDEQNAVTRAYAQYYGPNYSATTNCNYLGLYPRNDDATNPALVIPGTAKIRITLAWGSGVVADELGIHFTPNGPGDRQSIDPVPPETVMELAVTAQQWDSPHQSFTLWSFCLNTGVELLAGQAGEAPVIIDGPIHVKIELEKGSEPLVDPPHEDHWQGRDVLNLTFDGQHATTFSLKDEQVVAPGAVVMEMRHHWTYQGTYAPLGEARDARWVLWWRTADMDPASYGVEDYLTIDPEPCGEYCHVYRLELEPHQTDAYYQSKSNWAWIVEPPDTVEEYTVDAWADLLYTLSTGVVHNLEITLYR